MTNGEKFKEIFSVTQVDDCDLSVYAWLPNHDAIEIPLEWWNAEYKEPKTGYWIDDEFGSKCSCCGIHTHLDKFDKPMKFKHCSMCGAKMVEPQESEDKNERYITVLGGANK